MLPLHPCLDVQTDLGIVLIGIVFFFLTFNLRETGIQLMCCF